MVSDTEESAIKLCWPRVKQASKQAWGLKKFQIAHTKTDDVTINARAAGFYS